LVVSQVFCPNEPIRVKALKRNAKRSIAGDKFWEMIGDAHKKGRTT
jgi:hypothetical protein